jgi:copper chaperone CopZ
MKKIRLKVTGMHCSSCEMLVTDSLMDTKGVEKAEASFKAGTVSVTYDEKAVKESAIRSIIEKEGYKIDG